MPRNAVIEAIREGAATSTAIAERLNIERRAASKRIETLRRRGRIEPTGDRVMQGRGQPLICWRVNETWVRPRKQISDATRAKLSAKVRAARLDPEYERRRLAGVRKMQEARYGVPAWVDDPKHRHIYREIARVLDEETAARWARKAKAAMGMRAS